MLFRKKQAPGKGDGGTVPPPPEPPKCGGTDCSIDPTAPKEIRSEEIVSFEATSALGWVREPSDGPNETLGFVSAFAAPAAEGALVFLETSADFGCRAERTRTWALVREDPFPSLAALVRECRLAEENGRHSQTHGLPENFGGSVRIVYADGEKISFSDNQSPILSPSTAEKIAKRFRETLAGEKIPLPDPSGLREIRFEETRDDGGWTRAVLTLHPDGTATNARSARYSDPTVYTSEKPVDAETVAAIRETIARNGLFGWAGLPDNGFEGPGRRTLTFILDGGREIEVRDGRLLPDPLRSGFFDIQLEMSVKR